MQTQRAQGRLALFELPKTSKSSMNIIENFENIFKHKLIAARRKSAICMILQIDQTVALVSLEIDLQQ